MKLLDIVSFNLLGRFIRNLNPHLFVLQIIDMSTV